MPTTPSILSTLRLALAYLASHPDASLEDAIEAVCLDPLGAALAEAVAREEGIEADNAGPGLAAALGALVTLHGPTVAPPPPAAPTLDAYGMVALRLAAALVELRDVALLAEEETVPSLASEVAWAVARVEAVQRLAQRAAATPVRSAA